MNDKNKTINSQYSKYSYIKIFKFKCYIFNNNNNNNNNKWKN